MDIELLSEYVDKQFSIREISAIEKVSYSTVRYWLKKHNLSTKGSRKRLGNLNPEMLAELVSTSNSTKSILLALGLSESSGDYKALRYFADIHNIPLPNGKGTNGKKANLNDSEYFVSGAKRHHLRIRLINTGVPEICECGQGPIWQGKPLTLQVDHIDGDNWNNVISNLRFLCPNCHTQTDTYGKKKALLPQWKRTSLRS